MTITPTLIREYDAAAPAPEATETATFGLGCFWGPDAQFGAIEGAVRTRVGYAGGTKVDPTYHALGDHTEVLQVDYDPDQCSFRDLVAVAVRSHDPRREVRKTQYQNVLFAGSAAQREVLHEYLADVGLDPEAIATRVERLSRFYPAEDYHQKYSLRSDPSLSGAFEDAGYDDAALRESPAAAKLNGVAAGNDLPDGDDLATAFERTVGGR